MAFNKKFEDEVFIDENDPDDAIFLEQAAKMRHNTVVSKSRKLLKRFVAELPHKGMRHEVWITRIQVRFRPSDKGLAGYLKRKALDL